MRRLGIMLVVFGLVAVTAAPVAAAKPAPPANDEIPGAIAVGGLPATFRIDTSRATVNETDAGCGAGAEDQATVWFAVSLDAQTTLAVDTAGSSYHTGVNVFAADDPTSVISCVEDGILVALAAGDYLVMVADIDQDRKNGGTLDISFSAGPPPLDIDVAIDGAGSVTKDGAVTVRGTASCSEDTSFGIELSIEQSLGNFKLRGFGVVDVDCTAGSPAAWTATISAQNGRFGSGDATVSAFASQCNDFSCDDASATRTIRLRR